MTKILFVSMSKQLKSMVSFLCKAMNCVFGLSVALKWAEHSIELNIIQNKRLSEAELKLVNNSFGPRLHAHVGIFINTFFLSLPF